MNKILLVSICILLLAGCKSSEKLVLQGNYDAAIDKSIKKMLKGKAQNEDRELLDRAYILANQRDEEHINFLLTENKAENWDQIYQRYYSLNNRQSKIQKVLPFKLYGETVNYDFIDYNEQIIEAKTNAAAYFYKRGISLMALNTKDGYRQAYANFLKTENYRAEDYPDIQQLINDSQFLGTSRVLVEVENPRNFRLPPDFFDNMLSIDTRGLNSGWVEYYVKDLDKSVEFDYYAVLVIEGIDLSHGEVQTENYMREKRVDDGYDYVLDRRGNVMKDSLGNDIKVQRYKQLTCVVVQTKKTRTATIRGEVEFSSLNPQRILKKEPVAGTSIFENVYATARGDFEALLPEDKLLLKQREIPYPDDLSMIYDCTEILRDAYRDVLHDNKRLLH